MSFVKSKGFKYVKNLLIGVGAAFVLAGALFKIESWPFASEMLILGMGKLGAFELNLSSDWIVEFENNKIEIRKREDSLKKDFFYEKIKSLKAIIGKKDNSICDDKLSIIKFTKFIINVMRTITKTQTRIFTAS